MSSRSLMEPTEMRSINSILNASFPNSNFVTAAIDIPTVLPERTFLEKIFLLHEEFSQEPEKIRVERLSRHFYDIERLMDTIHGTKALENMELYNNIVAHRMKFNALRGLDYERHSPDKIKIIPPDTVIKKYEYDYSEMTRFMIYGNILKFEELMARIIKLQNRINNLNLT